MQSSDRLRIFRNLGLAIVALLLLGGAVFAFGGFGRDTGSGGSPPPSPTQSATGSVSPSSSASLAASPSGTAQASPGVTASPAATGSPQATARETAEPTEIETPEP